VTVQNNSNKEKTRNIAQQ